MSTSKRDEEFTGDPAFSGTDHVARAEFFLDLSTQAQSRGESAHCSWFLGASIYSAAALGALLEEQFVDFKRGDKEAFLEEIKKVRWSAIVMSLRVHDFHRHAIRFSENSNTLHGPVRLKTSTMPNSAAGLVGAEGGFKKITAFNGSVTYNRALQIDGYVVRDAESKEGAPINQMLTEYLGDMKALWQKHRLADFSPPAGDSTAPL